MSTTPQIAILTPEDIARIAREAYEAGHAAKAFPDRMMNTKEAAAFLGVSAGTVYTLAANGDIPCRKVGDRYIFNPVMLAEWAANREK